MGIEAMGYRGVERRRLPRHEVQLTIRELRPNQAPRRVVSMNELGMYVRTSVAYSAGTLAVFEIFHDSDSKVVAPAWVVRADANEGMAFEFMEPQMEFTNLTKG